MKSIGKFRSVTALAASATLLSIPATSHAATFLATVIATGLDNPRGLTIGPDGAVYVAEAGTFNSGPTAPAGEGAAAYGPSGAITKIDGGVQSRVISGLPSFTNVVSGSASGPQDIAFYNGTGYFVVGLGADPGVRSTYLGSAPGAADLASLFSFSGTTVTKIADLGTYEQTFNPAGDQVDSNPFHLVAGPNGLLVTDAGGNSLLNVTDTGVISTLATFPEIGGVDAVPTGIAVGPDGGFFVGQLTGFPFIAGEADIFRIDPVTSSKIVFASGLTNITDIAWGIDGSLYALQFSDTGILTGGTGSIQKVNGDGTFTTIFSGLVAPTGLEIGSDGAFYVSIFSPAPGIGQVLRIAEVPEPGSWATMLIGFGALGTMVRRRRAGLRGVVMSGHPVIAAAC